VENCDGEGKKDMRRASGLRWKGRKGGRVEENKAKRGS